DDNLRVRLGRVRDQGRARRSKPFIAQALAAAQRAGGFKHRSAHSVRGSTFGRGRIAIGMSVWRAREAKAVTTYGSARWATREEVRSAGLLCPDGVFPGRHAGDYLRHDGPEHVLCFAPTRSGKGVGLVVPTLLAWPGSAIVHDIK